MPAAISVVLYNGLVLSFDNGVKVSNVIWINQLYILSSDTIKSCSSLELHNSPVRVGYYSTAIGLTLDFPLFIPLY